MIGRSSLPRRRLAALVSLLVATLFAVGPVGAQTLQPAANGRINVTATFRGQPVGNLAVLINNSATNPNTINNFDGANFTGAGGTYSRDLPRGNYDVHVADYPNNNSVYGSQVIYEINLPDGGNVNVAFELDQPAGSITGVVTRPDGSPAAGVLVDAFGSSAAGDTAPFGWGNVRTGADGSYTLGRLRPNEYYVIFASEIGYRIEGTPVRAGQTTTNVNLPNPGPYGFVGGGGSGGGGGTLPGGLPAGSLPTLGGHVPVVGDWDGNGTDTPGVRADIHFLLLNSIRTAVDPDVVASFGAPEHLPLSGDWDGNGSDTIGVWAGGWFLLKNSNTSGGDPDIAALFGNPDAVPLVGDWDGDGRDSIGMWSGGTFFLSNGQKTTGAADLVFAYGNPTSVPLVGDWDGDGTDTVGIWENGTFFFRNSNTAGFGEVTSTFGNPDDVPLVGDWDGNGTDTVGIRRGSTFAVSNVLSGRVDAEVVYGAPTSVRR